MRVKKLKTYVITVSVRRQNYEFWKKRIDEVNKGNAILSVRQWSGKPYNSKQIEIKQFKQGELDYQRVLITGSDSKSGLYIGINTGGDFKHLSDKSINKLANNDGLTLQQFQSWFKYGAEDGIIIHWTKLKY